MTYIHMCNSNNVNIVCHFNVKFSTDTSLCYHRKKKWNHLVWPWLLFPRRQTRCQSVNTWTYTIHGVIVCTLHNKHHTHTVFFIRIIFFFFIPLDELILRVIVSRALNGVLLFTSRALLFCPHNVYTLHTHPHTYTGYTSLFHFD